MGGLDQCGAVGRPKGKKGGVPLSLDFVADGPYANMFSRYLEALFRRSGRLAEDLNNFTIMGRGWYVNLNLSNKQKFSSISRYAAIAGLKYGIDYEWKLENQDRVLLGEL